MQQSEDGVTGLRLPAPYAAKLVAAQAVLGADVLSQACSPLFGALGLASLLLMAWVGLSRGLS